MPALLEQTPEQTEAKLFAATGSWPSEQPHHRHNPRKQTTALLMLVCATLFVAGIVLRVWELDRVPGVNGDEAWYGVQSQRFLDEYIFDVPVPAAERVDFRTPTGNVWNPFLMIPRIVLDLTLTPSVWALRLPALVSGILTLLVNFWLCRRAVDRATAWLTTALFAVLPIAVLYSRLGWDTCQSILFCLPVVYLPWISEREAWSVGRTAFVYALALAAALLIHPTNIFLVTLSAVLFWPRLRRATKLELSSQSRALLAAAALVGAFAVGSRRGAWADVNFSNATSALSQWAGDLVGLLNGITVYGSISLPAAEWPAARGWLLLLSMPTIGLLIAARYRAKTAIFPPKNQAAAQRYASLFDGTCLALLCFLGVAGPAAIQPGYERYGLWIIAPVTLLIVLAYAIFARRARVAVSIVAIAQVVLLLAGYWQYCQRRFDVPAAEQQLADWTYQADNFADWSEMDRALSASLDNPSSNLPRYIIVDPADPQRWWFEWKWRYLSHDSRLGHQYQWLVLPLEQAEQLSREENHAWHLHSNPASGKEKISIRNLW